MRAFILGLLAVVCLAATVRAWCISGAPAPAGTVTPPAPPARDADDDGLNDLQETFFGTLPDNPDTDGDGTLDGQEDADGDGVPNEDEPTIFSFEVFRDPFVADACDWDLAIEGTNLFGLRAGGVNLDPTPDEGVVDPLRGRFVKRSFNKDTRILLRLLCRKDLKRVIGDIRLIAQGKITNTLPFRPMLCDTNDPKGMAAAIVQLKTRVKGVKRRLDYVAIGGCNLVFGRNNDVVAHVDYPDHRLTVSAPFGAFQLYPTRILIPIQSRALPDPLYPYTDLLQVGDTIRVATRDGQTEDLPIQPVIAQLRFPAKNLRDDHDGDRLKTNLELLVGTDPLVWDTDHDGLSDGFELKKSHTDPRDPDTDGDGIGDREQYRRTVVQRLPGTIVRGRAVGR